MTLKLYLSYADIPTKKKSYKGGLVDPGGLRDIEIIL